MSNDVIKLVAFSLAPALIVFVWQMILFRIARGKSGQLVTIASMVLGYPAFFVLVFLAYSEPLPGLYPYMFLLYSFVAYTYFHIFNMSETSRRVRMLSNIYLGRMKSIDSLNELYDENAMIKTRLDRLVALGQLRHDGDLYYSNGRLFAWTGWMFYFLGCLLDRPWKPVREFLDKAK